MSAQAVLDKVDKTLVNALQGGFPLTPEPFAEVAERLGLGHDEVIERISRMLNEGILTRFGPLYNADAMGGGLTLAAMKVPGEDFERVAELVNALPEVAHNYQRDHDFNMWFVLATESPRRIAEVIGEIERATGLDVLDMPKEEEFFVGLRLKA